MDFWYRIVGENLRERKETEIWDDKSCSKKWLHSTAGLEDLCRIEGKQWYKPWREVLARAAGP